MKKTILIVNLVIFIALLTVASEIRTITVKRDDKTLAIVKAEVAQSAAEHAKGLMFRKEVPIGEGMFFIFEKDTHSPFWMKNTYISLDIIFIDGGKKIVSIAKDTKPLSEDRIYSKKPYRYVLEVPAGFTDKYKIKAGDSLLD